ncbi:MAG: anaerobic ribonucleoside-triphosphate reductase activating protein [Clostridia bacterium]|nr:anaerobic ribonucleoside-triphosphate reductase activating protein [Clostridia bacterium]
MKIRIAGITRESVVDGPGLRAVIFTQGCPRCCKGCHNPDTLDPNGGIEMDVEEVLEELGPLKLIKGVTFSGGEPFIQAVAVAYLARRVKAQGKDIVTFTGYTFEELMTLSQRDEGIKELLALTNLLIDGPFREEEKDLSLSFRGSRNQRLIDVPKSLSSGKVYEYCLE